MKKIIGWILVILIVVMISVLYHKSITEDTVVDDVDLEGLVEHEVSNDNIESVSGNKDAVENMHLNDSKATNQEVNSVVDSTENYVTNNKDTNYENNNEESSLKNDDLNKGTNGKLEVISGSYSSLSNETNAWGFVRKPEGTRPELYGPYTKVLDNYDGIYVGNNEEKIIYLTFDEGYENGYTASILDSLKAKNVVAVFFVTMPYVKANPDLIQRMIDEGHIVGNHV